MTKALEICYQLRHSLLERPLSDVDFVLCQDRLYSVGTNIRSASEPYFLNDVDITSSLIYSRILPKEVQMKIHSGVREVVSRDKLLQDINLLLSLIPLFQRLQAWDPASYASSLFSSYGYHLAYDRFNQSLKDCCGTWSRYMVKGKIASKCFESKNFDSFNKLSSYVLGEGKFSEVPFRELNQILITPAVLPFYLAPPGWESEDDNNDN